jgi:hypothetical protein
MREDEQHVSDEDLLLAADGERGQCGARVQSHLESCAQCRSRAAQMESLLRELAQAEEGLVELPSIAAPRAMLRTRLADLSAGRGSLLSRVRAPLDFLATAAGLTALAALGLVAGVLAFRHSPPADAEAPFPSAGYGLLPDRALTPGVARRASLTEICSLPREEVVKEVSPTIRRRVFAEYGIPLGQSDKYEVDYLISPGLGGDDDIRNLWPEPYNAAVWNAHRKDALEERLHELVCLHQVDLSVAQEAISGDWIAAYEKYVRAAPAPAIDPDVKNSLLPLLPGSEAAKRHSILCGTSSAPAGAPSWS